MKCSFADFLQNPESCGWSSLRQSARPLHNVLHSLYVLARVRFGLRRISELCSQSQRFKAIELENTYRRHYDDTVDVLDENALWTGDGQLLMTDIRALAEA